MIRVLIVEDGTEYVDTLTRFLPVGFAWTRAGSGPDALAALAAASFDAVFLDMRFDRVPAGRLLGDLDAAIDRFNGDGVQARRFLEDQQGTYILAALRDAGHRLPVLWSYDFGAEPRRWERLAQRNAPLDYLSGNAGPPEIAAALHRLVGR